MRDYVLGVTEDSMLYIEIAAVIVSIIALFVSYFSLKESKKARIELSRAFLSIELIQTAGKLYVMLHNIGNTYAYDMKITATSDFVNGFENLSIIQPGSTYGFLLLNTSSIYEYPETITFYVKYRDYYSSKYFVKQEYTFNIMDYIKYDICYNKEFEYYDIKKSF